MQVKTAGFLVICLAFLLTACNRQAATKQAVPAVQTKPAVRVRIDLPLTLKDFHFNIPQGTVAKMNADMTESFDPPIHPLGSISSLILKGKEIPLASSELKDGILHTAGYGDIEILLTGETGDASKDIELMAYPADIEKLRANF